jgi:hypothetical protein
VFVEHDREQQLMPRIRPAAGEQGGQTLVEFAIVLPIFLLVVFGLFDVGRLVFANSTLSQGAREGARVAAAEASWIGVSGPACVPDESQITSARPGAHVCPTDVSAFKSHIVDAVNRMTTTVGPISAVYITCHAGTDADPMPEDDWTDLPGGDGNGCQDGLGNAITGSGDLVGVRIEHDYQTFTPFISSIIGTVRLSGSATMIAN